MSIYERDTKVVTLSGVENATGVSVTMFPPTGAAVEKTLAGGGVTDLGAGSYRAAFDFSDPGIYWVVVKLTSAVGEVSHKQTFFNAEELKE